MERDDFTCRSCGSKDKTLNVHHKTYRKNAEPWDYEDENFATYCEECHGTMHYEKDFLMMHVDSAEKMRRLATIAYFCKANEISIAQIICTFAALQNGRNLRKEDFEIGIQKSEIMIAYCKNFIKYAKRKLKSK